jgi:ADP-ribose pyrophosphatase
VSDRHKNRPATPWIRARTVHDVSPWVRLVEREVDFGAGRVERYHALEQADYVCILAITPEGLIPAVRRYRPALERYTRELPARMVDPGRERRINVRPRAPRRDRPSDL